ncbi:MAG: MogA/MoaB family molybdenum cofactor biosynthesis protein, partial [Nitrospirota bacterium]
IDRRLGRVVETVVVPDERPAIRKTLVRLVDARGVDLVVTTGGTGVSPRDVTPEATREVIDREVPGVAELMRLKGLCRTPRAMISRGVCGIRKRSVVLNLPGSPRGAVESLNVVLPLLPHLIGKVQGDQADCSGIGTLQAYGDGGRGEERVGAVHEPPLHPRVSERGARAE